MTLITETQFRTLCIDVYRDRRQIYEYHPAASRPEALLWMILGSLFSLLSLRDEEIPVIAEPTTQKYVEAICAVVEAHRDGDFDPRRILADLIYRPESTNDRAKTEDD
jgi:hypothetical protein